MSERRAMDEPESAYAWVRLFASLFLLSITATGMYAAIVVLKPVALEFEVSRSVASMPYFVTMLGFGLGGMMMGRLSDRYGVYFPAMFGGVSLACGYFVAANATSLWMFILAHALLISLFGMSAFFVPLIADISHWFDRRRGLAVGIVISGNYVAGAVWPPIIQHFFDAVGWRQTYIGLGILCFFAVALLGLPLYRRVDHGQDDTGTGQRADVARPLGFAPGTLQMLLSAAGIGCCVAMATPQVHIIAHAGDLGYSAARGSEMLALMLAFGVVSRLVSGWISDRIGGFRTLLLGSSLQVMALFFFIPVDGLAGLYLISALFGLSQGGIVPSYAIIVRAYFHAGDAGRRIGVVLFFSMVGMALGGWMAGALYDLTGSYDAAFVNAILFNIVNIAIAGALLRRALRPSAAMA